MHPSEDELDDYVLDRLLESQRTEIEDHLLFCETCRNDVQAINNLIQFLLAAERARHHRN